MVVYLKKNIFLPKHPMLKPFTLDLELTKEFNFYVKITIRPIGLSPVFRRSLHIKAVLTEAA